MTFSILIRDPSTGAIGGAAATGSLCVGGWVLRGTFGAGMSASQGAAPSVYWGEDVLDVMRNGTAAPDAVHQITQADPGRAHRQLTALDMTGSGGAFSGDKNTDEIASKTFDNGVAAGNMLDSKGVIDALVDGYQNSDGPLGARLLNALKTAEAAGGDSRGLLSASLLILPPDHAPITLRIDYHETDAVGALQNLYARATSGDYARWANQVPNPANKMQTPD